jgi:hypothetical protein
VSDCVMSTGVIDAADVDAADTDAGGAASIDGGDGCIRV